MNQKEVFEKIEFLLQFLKESWQTGYINFKEPENKVVLKDVYRHIFPNAHVDLACGTCVKNYLNIMLSYYEREFPKYQESQADQPVVEATEEDIVKAMMIADNEPNIVEAKQKLSRAEILAKARAARKQEQKEDNKQ
jgi:hypothetical protein